jgi:CBS domain-containing protein
MYPRMSLPAKMKGDIVMEKLTCPYPALPVVNDNQEVIGVVSEYDILEAVRENRTIHEFSAESIMSCGHAEHGVCATPVTVNTDTPIEDIVDLFYESRLSVLPVLEGKKLAGLVTRKSIINAMAEEGFWSEHEFKQRVKTVSR